MNRIYQGRVSNVEIPDGKDNWKSLDSDPKTARDKWQALLWHHHELFQDAVNYYFAAFAAMIDESASDAPLNTFKRAVTTNWEKHDGRKGQWNLPFGNATRALGLSADATFEEFSKTLFAHSGTLSTPVLRHAAIRYVFARALEELQGEADAAHKLAGAGRDNWPKLKILCSPKGLSGTTPDTVRYQQEKKAREIALSVEQGGSLSVDDAYAFKTSPERKTWTADQTRAEIKSRFKSLLADAPELQSEVAEFDEWVEKLPADFCMASPGKKPQGDFDAALLLALRPNSAGLRQVFVRKTKWRRDNEPELVENDAVADARVDDVPVFPFFTNLVCSPSNPKKPSFAVWPDFEKLAFIEVFTKIGQLCLEHRRRSHELARLRQRQAHHDELFADDERITLLRELTGRS